MSVCSPASGNKRQPQTFRATHVAAAVGLLLCSAAPASAQQASQAPAAQGGQTVETIVVTGIRRSMDTSLNLKRDAQGVVDGIVAEDIGKFPDTNLAESMQRISGVSIDRTNGEGSKVTIRGVGPDFNLVLLNGRQMPASAIEATAASNSRAFDFANLASESIAALEVYKTSRAHVPPGGLGGTINIKTAKPLDNPGQRASFGIKGVYDQSNENLPSQLQGDKLTPEVSGIYSNTFADGKFGVALSGSYQERHLGYADASVGIWRTFRGDEANWGTIPQPGQPGSENIANRPGPTDIYSVPQNIAYGVNGVQRTRTNGQLTLQFAPSKELVTTLDYTYSENKLQNRRNELSAWFNFGPSSSAWTNGPAAAPLYYEEAMSNQDIAMGGGRFAMVNENHSVGLNVAWKPSKALSFEFDAHKSSAESRPNSRYGSNSVVGTASYNRGNTRVDFSQDLPVLSITGSTIDPAQMLVTGSSFRNSYMKSEVQQAQFSGKYKFEEGSRLDFGLSVTEVKNRSAYGFVQQNSWSSPGATNASGDPIGPGAYPDDIWQRANMASYFNRFGGSSSANFFSQFFVWDFDRVRDIAARESGSPSMYQAPSVYSVDRRVKEKSDSVFLQYTTDWEVRNIPMGLSAGVRNERTSITSSAMVPSYTGINWVGNNEFDLVRGAEDTFTTLKGRYSYWLPSIDFDAELSSNLKFRASYGETIGRPKWGEIQGGQTLDQLVRIGGGTGQQGNPGLKPLKSKNIDLSLEFYYAKSSYVALGYFRKNISNYSGVATITATPFNLRTPARGVWFQEAVSSGGCPESDTQCIRTYILNRYDGVGGVNRAAGVIPAQPNDPVATFTITTPVNTRSASLWGAEVNWQHMFGNSGFGVAANYTYVDSGLKYDNNRLGEQFALEGLSNTANLVAFYEDERFQTRLAYNWRGKFLATMNGGGLQEPVYTEPYSQLDVSMGYKITPALTVQFEAINLTDETVRQHGRRTEQVWSAVQNGRRFMIGARYTF